MPGRSQAKVGPRGPWVPGAPELRSRCLDARGKTDRSSRAWWCSCSRSLAVGVLMFQVGKAAILRSDAQTAADAAALAGAREIKRQLEAQWATTGTTDLTAINQAAVVAQDAPTTPPRTTARLDRDHPARSTASTSRRGSTTEQELGEDAEAVGATRTRRRGARPAPGSQLGPRSVGDSAVRCRRGGVPGGGTPKISDKEWEELEREDRPGPPDCDGRGRARPVPQEPGLHGVAERAPGLGGDPGHDDNPRSYHYKCGGRGAIDVNFGRGCGDLVPDRDRARSTR